LRQLKATGHVSPVLPSWLQAFDPAGLETGADEADPHHDWGFGPKNGPFWREIRPKVARWRDDAW
jgi:hypothetical protein